LDTTRKDLETSNRSPSGGGYANRGRKGVTFRAKNTTKIRRAGKKTRESRLPRA